MHKLITYKIFLKGMTVWLVPMTNMMTSQPGLLNRINSLETILISTPFQDMAEFFQQ